LRSQYSVLLSVDHGAFAPPPYLFLSHSVGRAGGRDQAHCHSHGAQLALCG